MGLISVVINVDTRDGFQNEDTHAEHMFEGCRSEDFLIDGVLNKIKFFDGFEIETIVFVDEHNPVPQSILNKLREIADTVVVRKHTHEPNFNDFSYISALAIARGEYVCHFDQDTAAFANSKQPIIDLINMLEVHKYISYPSHWTPKAVYDDSFNYMWCSTRFFICKRETLDFTEIIKCQRDYDYFCEKYQPSRRCHWLEHILSLVANNQTFYPPIDLDNYAIFSWKNYRKGLLQQLNNIPYEEVKNFIHQKGGIQYPNDIHL